MDIAWTRWSKWKDMVRMILMICWQWWRLRYMFHAFLTGRTCLRVLDSQRKCGFLQTGETTHPQQGRHQPEVNELRRWYRIESSLGQPFRFILNKDNDPTLKTKAWVQNELRRNRTVVTCRRRQMTTLLAILTACFIARMCWIGRSLLCKPKRLLAVCIVAEFWYRTNYFGNSNTFIEII